MKPLHLAHLAPFSLACLFALASCATTQGRQPQDPSAAALEDAINNIADDLVSAAEVRTEISSMRVCLHEFHGSDVERVYGHWAKQQGVDLASARAALEHEFMVALSSRVHLLDSELAGTGTPRLREDSLESVADHLNATHALVGSFVRRDDDLLVSVRLVDADSLLIVAAARGRVPYAPLIDRGALAWNFQAEPEARPEYPADSFESSAAQGPAVAELPVTGPSTLRGHPTARSKAKGTARPEPVAEDPVNVPLERVDGPAALRLRTFRPSTVQER